MNHQQGFWARMPFVGFAGSCFFLTWMNGAFFSTALSSFRSQAGATFGSDALWNLSLAGVFVGLVVLTALERRWGQIALNQRFLVGTTAAVCLGTLLMVVSPALGDGWPFRLAAWAGGFSTGLFTAPFYIAWTQVYGCLETEDAEIVIPFAVALGQLLSTLFCGLEGLFAVIALISSPVLSLICLKLSFDRLGQEGRWAGLRSAGTDAGASLPGRATQPIPAVAHWKTGLLYAAIWLSLSMVTALANARLTAGDGSAHGASFLVSFVVLLTLLLLYVYHSKRLSLLQAFRIILPIVTVSLLLVLVVPRDVVPDAFLAIRTAAMFFWALLWIFCAKALHEGAATATALMGRVRGWIQGGALASVPLGMLFASFPNNISTTVCFCVALLVASFSFALPALLKVRGPEGAAAVDEPASTSAEMMESAFVRRCEELTAAYGLTPREAEIMAFLAKGRDLPYIRDKLYISRNTVNTHIRHIYEKMGIHSKQELINLAESEQ